MSNTEPTLEQYAQSYSDLFKSVHGFRPRGYSYPSTIEEYQDEHHRLWRELDEQEAYEKCREQEALCEVTAEVREICKLMNCGITRALRTWFIANGYEEQDHPGWSMQKAEAVLWDRDIPTSAWKHLIRFPLNFPKYKTY